MQKINFRNILFESLVIISLSIISGFVFNVLSDNGIPLIYQEAKLQQGQSVLISEALQFFNSKNALFIDARSANEFGKGHIQDAISIPFSGPLEKRMEAIFKLDREKIIIVYCVSEKCGTSKRLADLLIQFGFKKVLIFAGGWEKWKNAEYPIE